MATSSTKYLRKRTIIEISRSSNYSDPIEGPTTITEEYQVTRYKKQEYLAATGGTTVDLSEFGTIQDLVIYNRDSTNYVDTTHRTGTTAGTAQAQSARIDASKAVSLGDVTPGNDLILTANSADCEVIIEVWGSV